MYPIPKADLHGDTAGIIQAYVVAILWTWKVPCPVLDLEEPRFVLVPRVATVVRTHLPADVTVELDHDVPADRLFRAVIELRSEGNDCMLACPRNPFGAWLHDPTSKVVPSPCHLCLTASWEFGQE